jgi:hypothetical protein
VGSLGYRIILVPDAVSEWLPNATVLGVTTTGRNLSHFEYYLLWRTDSPNIRQELIPESFGGQDRNWSTYVMIGPGYISFASMLDL